MQRKLTNKELILKAFKDKSSLKQDVFQKTTKVFEDLKAAVKETVAEIKEDAYNIDKRIVVDYKEKDAYEIELRVAGDIIIFYMHTNIFEFDKSHPVWKTTYLKEDPFRSYCGMICVYNFLADSFKFNRSTDIGYLIARIFMNMEQHYFVEGKRQLGFLYNDFPNNEISKGALKNMVASTILYALDFDLLTPPFESMQEISVSQIVEASENMRIKTGKRLGFRFQADNDQIE